MDIPVFRQPVKTVVGTRTSPDLAWRYEDFCSFLRTLGFATGFEDIITVYVLRQETGNMINGKN